MRIGTLIGALLLSCASAPPPAPPPSVIAAVPEPAPPPWTRTPAPGPLAKIASSAPPVTRVTLDTGLRIVVVEHHRRPIVTVSLVLAHGALSDPEGSAGLTWLAVNLASDFYETMGVNDMPADERSFRMRVSEMGGAASFGVESDFSDVRIAGYAADAGKYLGMLADAMRNPRHGMRSFDGRRFSAMDRFEDIDAEDPLALQRLIEQSAFGADHPYARSIYGTTESLESIELQEMMEHQSVIFVPTGATLLIVGDVKPDQVLAEARKRFGNWQGYKDLDPMPAVPPPALPAAAREVSFVPRPGSSTLLTCALRPLPEVRGSDPILRVLASVIGQGFGSRLGMALREENGLTYGANAEIVRRRQASALIACSALQGEKGEQGLRLFRGVFDGLREHAITEDEVRRAKALRLAEIESSWDDVLSSTHTWMEALTLGTGTPRLEQERAELERVSVKDVQKLARTLFSRRAIRWVVAGEKSIAAKAVEASGFGALKPYVPRG